MRGLILIFSIIICFSSCDPKRKNEEKSTETAVQKQVFTYNLNRPDEKYILPEKLTEISGLSYSNIGQLYCVNDEQGKIFVYSTTEKEIIKTIDFGKNGDYEGIEIVENKVYVLSSDGKIKVIDLANEETKNIDCSQKEVLEYEGLAYDSDRNSLLLAAKEMKGNKRVYEYNLSSESMKVKYIIPDSFIEANSDKKEFKPSGIAVHPISKEIYILASAGKKLIVITQENGKVKQYNLDNQLFAQPEGICFSPTGELFISSEGKGGSGYILKFDANHSLPIE
jgi:uncharacterized protein YjiK